MTSASPLLGVYGERDLSIVRGQGSYAWDAEGNRLLDCVSGVAVNALGHCHPAVVEAIRSQAGTLIHASNLYVQPSQRELATRLIELSGFHSVFFCNSGTEADEGAFKFARRHFIAAGQTDRIEIISLLNSFHGRTYASMAATGQDKVKLGFGPLPSGFINVSAGDPAALRAAINERTAAVIYEPILAEGGVLELSGEMIAALREIQSHGVLLIADEIQTGLWRTGPFLGSETLGIKPDIVTLAKPLGGGLPLGAVLVNAKVAASMKQGDHGSTFGGNPVACAAGLAVLKIVSNPGFQTDMRDRMAFLRTSLEKLVVAKSAAGIKVGPVRGKGFLLGVKWSGDLAVLLKKIRSEGVMVHKAGTDVLRMLPPLNISREEIGELLGALERAMV